MQLREDKLEKLQEWLSGRLNQQINPQNRKLSWFLTEFKHQPANAISDYLWSELMLQVQGKEQARELFRAAILANVKNVLSMWGQGHDIPKLSINYMAKNNSNAGVELIDFLCNLVYQNGSVLPNSASSAVKKIYQMISVEVMKI